MKRPFAIFGYIFIASFSVALFCYQISGSIYLVAFISILLIIFTAKKSKKLTIYPIAGLLFLIYSTISINNYYDISPSLGENVSITGMITERSISYDNSSYDYILKIDMIDGISAPNNLYASFDLADIEAEPYDYVSFNGEVVSSDFGYAYSNELYRLSNGIALRVQFLSGIVIEDANILVSALTDYKEILKKRFIFEFDSNGGIAYGILTGDKSLIGQEDYYNYLGSGVLHIFAVSGLHIAIIASLFLLFFKFFIINYKVRYILAAIATTLFYIIFCFGSVSAARALIMAYLVFASKLLTRRYDFENSLGVATVIILLLNPRTAVDISFLLSYFSVLGIIKVYPILKSYIKIQNILFDSILITISVSFATIIPLSMMNGRVYPAAIIANIVILPTVAILLVVLLISALLIYLSLPIPDLILLAVKVTGDVISVTTDFLSRFRSGSIISDIYLIAFVLISIVLFKLLYKKENKFIFANSIGLLILVVAIISGIFPIGVHNGIYLYRNHNDYAVVAIEDRDASIYLIGSYLSTERTVAKIIDENGYTDITLYLEEGKESRLLADKYDIDIIYIEDDFITFNYLGKSCIISYGSKPNFNNYYLAVNDHEIRADIILDRNKSEDFNTISISDSKDLYLIEATSKTPKRIYNYEE